MHDFTLEELNVILCALGRHRDHMFCTPDYWSDAEHDAIEALMSKAFDEFDRRETA